MDPEQAITIRLAEYNALRKESADRAGHQQTLMNVNLTAVAAILALAARTEEFRPDLLLILPLVSPVLAALWTDHHVMIAKNGHYVRDVLWQWEPAWEDYHTATETRAKSRLFKWAVGLGFLTPAVAAIVFNVFPEGAAEWVGWVVGTVLTGLAGWYMLLAFLKPAKLIRSGESGARVREPI